MSHNYVSDAERHALSEAKKKDDALDAVIAKKNSSLVGEPKEYKGVSYQMKQNGLYECLDASKDVRLSGQFTSPQVIKKLIDDMEKSSKFKI